MVSLAPDYTLVIMWVIFMAVLFFLSRFVFEPTLEIIAERENQGGHLKKESFELAQKTGGLTKQYQEKIAKARKGAFHEKELILNEAREQESLIINKAREQSEQVLHEVRSQLEKERKEAMLQLKKFVEEIAYEMFNKVLEKKAA